MRLSDQQHLGIRSSPRQCMRSKFLHSSHAPHGSSPSPAAGMIQLWLCSLGHPTPPGHFATCSWGSLMCFYHPVTTEKLRLQFCVEPLLKRGFFSIIVDKIGWKYTWTIRVYFKCWHWALLSRIHVQAQNFQQ